MKKLLSRILYIILFFSFTEANAQYSGIEIPDGPRKIDIPFEYYNNFILVRVNFNNSFPLRFIFDTGAEYTILTKREVADLLAIPFGRSYKIVGADLQTTLTAHLIKDINLKMGQAEAIQHNMLVLDEDYFRFEEFTGTEVHGIIGADLFKRFVVKINYQRRVISLYNPRYYNPPKSSKYKEVDITIYKNKPYLNSVIQLQSVDSVHCKLLLDTGASLALLLNTHSHPKLKMPENVIPSNIGAGLGGMLKGYKGRIQSLEVAGDTLTNLIADFQVALEIAGTQDTIYRNGIIGNEILNRFTIIINYPFQKMYLKANRKLRQKFIFDKSGLTLITVGQYNNTLVVQNVLANSPAAEAGIIRGDIIRAVNGMPTAFLSLKNASNMLRSKSGKVIKLKLRRLGYPIKRELVLRDLL